MAEAIRREARIGTQLEELRDQDLRVNDDLQFLSVVLVSLNEERERLENELKIEKSKKGYVKKIVDKLEIEFINKQLRAVEAEKSELAATIDALKGDCSELFNEMAELKEEMKRIDGQIEENERDLSNTLYRIHESQNQIILIEGNIKRIEKDIELLRDETVDLNKLIEGEVNESVQIRKIIERTQSEIDAFRSEKARLEKELSGLETIEKEQTRQFYNAEKELDKQIEKKQAEIVEIREGNVEHRNVGCFSSLFGASRSNRRKCKDLEKEIKKLREQKLEVHKQQMLKQRDIKLIRQSIKSEESKIELKEGKLGVLRGTCDEIRDRIAETKDKIKVAEITRTRYNEDLSIEKGALRNLENIRDFLNKQSSELELKDEKLTENFQNCFERLENVYRNNNEASRRLEKDVEALKANEAKERELRAKLECYVPDERLIREIEKLENELFENMVKKMKTNEQIEQLNQTRRHVQVSIGVKQDRKRDLEQSVYHHHHQQQHQQLQYSYN